MALSILAFSILSEDHLLNYETLVYVMSDKSITNENSSIICTSVCPSATTQWWHLGKRENGGRAFQDKTT